MNRLAAAGAVAAICLPRTFETPPRKAELRLPALAKERSIDVIFPKEMIGVTEETIDTRKISLTNAQITQVMRMVEWPAADGWMLSQVGESATTRVAKIK